STHPNYPPLPGLPRPRYGASGMTFFQHEYERPIREIDEQIEETESALRTAQRGEPEAPAVPYAEGASAVAAALPADLAALNASLAELQTRREELLAELYTDLSPWDTVRVARHPGRPQTRDYISFICKDFCELHGDRRFGDDPAMVTGFGRIGSVKCLIVGHQKGKTTQEKIACHFGCAHPEGYRKALAKMQM